MKISTFEKRTKGNAKYSNSYIYAKELLITKKRVYTCHTSGHDEY